MDRLDAAAIAVPGVAVRVVERCTSTNDVLLEEASGRPILVAAEEQTAGRGRRGRRWHSAPGTGITFSLGRRTGRPVRELAALSLVAGVAAIRALRALGAHRTSLKWPNDLVVDGAKLGGILVETRNGYAVIGIGINCRRTPVLQRKVRRKLAYLEDFVPAKRNDVIRRVGHSLMEALDSFEKHGLERLRVRLSDGRILNGIASGLATDGALQLLTKQGLQAVRSGRVVSARAA